jgi:hypothetical protein
VARALGERCIPVDDGHGIVDLGLEASTDGRVVRIPRREELFFRDPDALDEEEWPFGVCRALYASSAS